VIYVHKLNIRNRVFRKLPHEVDAIRGSNVGLPTHKREIISLNETFVSTPQRLLGFEFVFPSFVEVNLLCGHTGRSCLPYRRKCHKIYPAEINMWLQPRCSDVVVPFLGRLSKSTAKVHPAFYADTMQRNLLWNILKKSLSQADHWGVFLLL